MKSPTAANPAPLFAEIAADDAQMDQAIDAFLDGSTDGGEVFEALYGGVAEEPIPERLLAIVRGEKTVSEMEGSRPSAKILPFPRVRMNSLRLRAEGVIPGR